MSEHGKSIQILREQKGWTRSALAKMLGKSEQQIANWEKGDRNLNRPNIEKVIDAFGITEIEFYLTAYPDLLEVCTLYQKLPKSSQYKIKAFVSEEWENYIKLN